MSSLVKTSEVRTDPGVAARVGACGDITNRTTTGFAARRHGLGLLMALATFALLVWNLGRPALWLDEAASTIAIQRSWPNLWLLLRGADAPLVPYYALLKLLTTATTDLVPHAAAHPEIVLRWPSVLAVVIAVWVLTVWLARVCPPAVVLGAGVFLLASGGLSRYGQEARPYAIVLMAAVISTVLWARLVTDGRRRWVAAYALAVVVLIAANSLAGTLVLAHLAAALIAPERGRRRTAVLRTVIGAAIGGLLISPMAVISTMHGGGATRYPPLSAENLVVAFVHLFTGGKHPLFWVGPLLPFAILGLTRVATPGYRFVARLAAAWALVPPALLLPAVMVRPNLLIGRYLMFVVPAWAILGGLGVVTVFDLVRRITRVRAPGAVLSVALLAGAVWVQVPLLVQVRWPSGHGEDIRPALRAADTGANADLPIFVSGRFGAIEIAAYDRAAESRMIALHQQRDRPSIWPNADPSPVREQELRESPKLILLMRTSGLPNCDDVGMERTGKDISRCMPPVLRRWHYQVLSFSRQGRGWTFAVLGRQ